MIANVLAPLIDAEQKLLEGLHSIGVGWGLAIVGLTLFVRLCTVPLVVRQFKAQRDMRAHMPELKRLRQAHKADPQRLQQETMAYYRRHRINPLATFLPLLVQIPVFISLYYLMRTDVKSGLFGDAGFLFIPHLTNKPHGAVLAALLLSYLAAQTISSLIATRALQGGQRSLMLALPLLFAGVVTRVPAGLAVYWVTTSLWSLGQQVVFWRSGAGVAEPIFAGADPLALPDKPEQTEPQPVRQAQRQRPRSRKRKHGRRR